MEWLTTVNDFLWGYAVLYMLLGADVYLTIYSRFYQFRRLWLGLRTMLASRQQHKGSGPKVTSFQAFCTSLASRVGSGNLAGVGVAVYLGGPGALFWMWLVALFGMSTSLFETTLAQVYKEHTDENHFRGGVAFYVKRGLGNVFMAKLFAWTFLVSTGSVVVQSNSISESFKHLNAPPLAVGVAVTILTGIIICGGTHSIIKFSEAVVPVMAIAYILLALIVTLINITSLPRVLLTIIESAFTPRAALGYSVFNAMLNGVKRGLFSNEAGMGTAPNAAALATPVPNHPMSQGLLGLVGVFVDTILICSCTGFIILLSDQLEPGSGVSGIELTRIALESQLGVWSGFFLIIAMFFFAFTTIIASYYYAESNLAFLFPNSKYSRIIFRPIFLGVVLLGSVLRLEDAWAMTDISIAFSTVLNLIALVRLSSHVMFLIRDFERQFREGKSPVFDRLSHPFFDRTIAEGVWVVSTELVSSDTENSSAVRREFTNGASTSHTTPAITSPSSESPPPSPKPATPLAQQQSLSSNSSPPSPHTHTQPAFFSFANVSRFLTGRNFGSSSRSHVPM
eukprot:c7875_g1_i1.p1 GENE.c7875_g1_i1~~c7875_g1_i1.p1  ORF type:complete len:566 (+),score=122.59 c7875_g1_i1:50-1747(+)